MIKRIAFTASALAVFAAAAQAQAPFLSFADNSALSVARTDINGVDSSFTGAGAGYTSITAPVALTSVSFVFNAPPLTAFGTGSDLEEDAPTDGGSISVFDSVLGKLFDVSFDSGFLTADNFVASDLVGDNVVFSSINPLLAPYIQNDPALQANSVSFSFANPIRNGNTSVSYSTSASFASQPVPEPATMAALGLGAAAMLRRRRKA